MRDRAVAEDAVDQPARTVVVVAHLQVVGTALGNQSVGAVVLVAHLQVVGTALGDQPVGAVVLVGGDIALIVRFGVDATRRVVGPD